MVSTQPHKARTMLVVGISVSVSHTRWPAAASSVHRASSRSSGTEKSRRSWVPNSFPKQDQDSKGSATHGSFESYVPYLFGHV